MGKKQKKKRNKKYRPEGVDLDTPIVHRFVAEDEEKKTSKTKLKRWIVIGGITLTLLALLGILIF
jgi:hypothetical protein